MMTPWYERHGLKDDPFSINPAIFPDALIGYDRALEEIFYRVEAGSMLFVKGEPGTGKTAVLFRLLERLSKRHVIYLDCAKLAADVNVENLVKERGNFLQKLFGRLPSKAILVLDNVHNLSERNNERIKNLFDMDILGSVVFAGDGFTKASFSKSLKERISSVVVLEPLSGYHAVQIFRSRAPTLELLTEGAILAIFELTGRNPRAFLEGCSTMCAYATSRGLPCADERLVAEYLKPRHQLAWTWQTREAQPLPAAR